MFTKGVEIVLTDIGSLLTEAQKAALKGESTEIQIARGSSIELLDSYFGALAHYADKVKGE